MNRTNAEQSKVGSSATDTVSGGGTGSRSDRIAGGLRRLALGLVVLSLLGLPMAGAVSAQESGSSLTVDVPDTVEAGETIQVTYTIEHADSEKAGYLIKDAVPEGWTVEERASQTANVSVAYSAERDTILLLGYFQQGDTGSVTYNVTVPQNATGEATFSPVAESSINTSLSASPTVTIEGSTETMTVYEAVDTNDDRKIGLSELLSAAELWRNGTVVDGTGGETISLSELLEMAEIWRSSSSI